ncbi:MAG: hypothetical protein FJX76_22560, partial [Armatimonadetes bacterium]|nr:hypothetical protein [Armatimonadota bacterium]
MLLVVSLCVTGCRSSAGLPAPAPSTTPGVRSVNHLGTPQFALAGPDGEILFTDEGARAILRLDPESGGTTVLSRAGARGRGPAFTFPSGIARNGEGRLFVVDPDRVAVFAVN